jgi:hypothetical protein
MNESSSDHKPTKSRDEKRSADPARGGLRLNRREVIAGTGAVTALYAGGLLGAEPLPIWTVNFEPDPDLPGRSIVSILFRDFTIRTLREVAFGERARAHLKQIPLLEKGEFPPLLRDLRLTVHGIELARVGSAPEFFDLIFEFRHRQISRKKDGKFVVGNPSLDVLARGWVFGAKPAQLRKSVSPDDFKKAEIQLMDGAKFANRLREAIFGKRLPPPANGTALSLSIVPSSDAEPGRPLRWRVSVVKKPAAASGGLTVLTHPANSKLPQRLDRTNFLWAAGVDIWREVPASEKKPATKPAPAPAAGETPPDRAESRPARGPEFGDEYEKVVRTVGELIGVLSSAGERRTTLGEHALSNGETSSLVLHKYNVTKDTLVRLIRVDASAGRTQEITTVAEIGGDLVVATTRPGKSGKTIRSEGPFHISEGAVRLSGPPDASSLKLEARLFLHTKHVDVATAHGPLIVSSPEQKSAAPGEQVIAAPAKIAAHDWQIKKFELTARVHSAAVPVSDFSSSSVNDGTRDYRVDLDFQKGGAEVLFRLHGLGDDLDTRPTIGRVSLGWIEDAKDADKVYGPRYSLPLEAARLKLLRWRDLAQMTFEFAGIDLTNEDGKFYLRPRGLARAQTVDTKPAGQAQDPRPVMVVELPPQHLAEEAFFERREVRPMIPAYPLAMLDELTTASNAGLVARQLMDALRSAYERAQKQPSTKAKERLAWRTRLSKLVDELSQEDKKAEPVATFITFRDKFAKLADEYAKKDKRFSLPQEQRVYVGPEFLDPAARFMAEITSHELSAAANADLLFDDLPEDPIGSKEFESGEFLALFENGKQKLPGATKAQLYDEAEKQAALLRPRRDPFYTVFKTEYDSRVKAGEAADLVKASSSLQTYVGRTPLRHAIEKVRARGPMDAKALEQFLALVSGAKASALKSLGLSGEEEPKKIARARLSGTSRLAFRLNTDDYERPGGKIPLTFDELTNWSRHELVVVRRAEKTLKTYADGGRRPAWDRVEETDLALQLLHQGFTRAGWSRNADQSLIPNQWFHAAVSVEQRLGEVVASAMARPTPFQTSIELPFRLHLSPAQDGRFRTRHAVPPWIHSRGNDACHAPAKPGPMAAEVEPLWTVELETGPNTALRAIWSPDFRPEAFLGGRDTSDAGMRQPVPARRNRAPMRGPYAPWAMGRDLSDASAFAQGVTRPPKFRTSLDAFDRHELTALTSLHGLPVIGRVKPETGTRMGIDQREPPPGFQVAGSGWLAPKPFVISDGTPDAWLLNDIYVPRPLDPDGLELALSSLGGFLRVNAGFEPPASILDGRGNPYFDALSVERWRHRIVLGRDISAEVVYKGYLFPIAVRCALIKVTERRFQPVKGRMGPVAVLRQHMFLQVGKPAKSFPAFRQPDDGRRVPFSGLKLITTVTPDIVDPYDQDGVKDEDGILPSGLIALGTGGGGAAFWPRTARRRGSEVKFEILVDGRVTTRVPLIFVDNAAANDPKTIEALCHHYNTLGNFGAPTTSLSLVVADIHGAKLTYAPQREAGDTQFETLSLTLAAEGRQRPDPTHPETYVPMESNKDYASDAFMQGADQPPFYPAMRRARIKLAQAERLTTQPVLPVDVAYDSTYALYGFDPEPYEGPNNRNEVFLSVLHSAPKLTFGSAGDRGGAVGRPELDIKGISRTLGTMGAKSVPTPAAPPMASTEKTPKPEFVPKVGYIPSGKIAERQSAAEFFNEDAKLLGLVKLKDIITLVLGQFEPKLREITEFAGGLSGDTDRLVRENVLLPINALLARLNQRLSEVKFNEENGRTALERIYPNVLTAMAAFEGAIKNALDASGPGDDRSRTLSAYTTVYTTGRRFVDALDRVVRDPITPLREAGRKLLDNAARTLVAEFESAVVPLLNEVKQYLDPLPLRQAACDLLREQVFKPLKDAIFALPLPNTLFGVAGIGEAAVSNAISDAIDAALDDEHKEAGEEDTWPGAKSIERSLFDEKVFWSRVVSRLRQQTGGLQARLKAEADAIENVLKSQAQGTREETQRAAERLRGHIWSRSFNLLAHIDETTKSFQQAGFGTPVKMLEALNGLGQLIGTAQQELLALAQVGQAFAQDSAFFCNNLLAAIDDVVHMVLPIDAVEEIAACVPTKDCAVWDKSSSGPFALALAVIRFARGARTVDAQLAALATRLRPAGFQQQALAGMVDSLRGALADLTKKLPDLDSEFVQAIVSMNRGVAAYREFSKTIATACTNTGEIPAALSMALRSLRQLNEDRLKLVKLVRDIAGPVHDFISSTGTFELPLDPRPGSGHFSIAPDPYGDPQKWTWSSANVANANNASQAVDAARKDVLGLVLPIITTSIEMLGATSSAGVPFDPPAGVSSLAIARAKRRIALAEKVDTLSKAAVGEAKAIKDWLDSVRAALSTKTLNSYIAKIVRDLQDLAAAATGSVDRITAIIEVRNRDVSDGATAFGELAKALSAERLQHVATEVAERLIGELDPDAAAVAKEFEKEKEAFERRLLGFLVQGAARIDEAYRQLMLAMVRAAPVTKAAVLVSSVFQAALEVRSRLDSKIDDLLKGLPATVATGVGQRLKGSLLAYTAPDPVPTLGTDGLAKQTKLLSDSAITLSAPASSDLQKLAAAEKVLALFRSWDPAVQPRFDANDSDGKGPIAPLFIVRNLARTLEDLLKEVLRANIVSIIDFGAIKLDIERELKQLIPARITLAYDLDTKIAALKPIFEPDTGTRLTLKARTVIDLLEGGSPKVSSSGELGPFKLRLIGTDFDIVTLSFDGARFGSETGGKFKTNIVAVELGKMVEFLQQVSSFLSFGSNGFYIRALFSPPGIEAGYLMPPMGFALGVIGISNISLTASCILPFDGTEAMMKVGVSTAEVPFLINVGVYGGGGHLALYASPAGIIGFEASFEFGAVVAFNIGPLSGTGRVTTGIFLRTFKKDKQTLSTVEGLVSAGGQASLAMFRFAALLQIRVGQQPGGNCVGTAIFTFSFSLGIRDITFRIVGRKAWGKGFKGDPGLAWNDLPGGGPRIMLAANGSNADILQLFAADPPVMHDPPRLVSRAVCKGANYRVYRSYFSEVAPWRPQVW